MTSGGCCQLDEKDSTSQVQRTVIVEDDDVLREEEELEVGMLEVDDDV